MLSQFKSFSTKNKVLISFGVLVFLGVAIEAFGYVKRELSATDWNQEQQQSIENIKRADCMFVWQINDGDIPEEHKCAEFEPTTAEIAETKAALEQISDR